MAGIHASCAGARIVRSQVGTAILPTAKSEMTLPTEAIGVKGHDRKTATATNECPFSVRKSVIRCYVHRWRGSAESGHVVSGRGHVALDGAVAAPKERGARPVPAR
jgi:hypothetical protein